MNEKFHNNISRIIFIIAAIAIWTTMHIVRLDSGTTIGEEEYQISQSIQLDRYYMSGGADKSILENGNPQFSGWFNALSARMSEIFIGRNIRDIRHGMNSIMAFIGIVFAGLLAKRCRNWRTGIFTMILLALSPAFFGHAMFNLEDIPVVTTFVSVLYFAKRLADHFPKPKIYDAVFFAISLALCITANPTCSFLIPAMIVLLVIGLLSKRKENGALSATIWYTSIAIISIGLTYAIAILLVPSLMQSPGNILGWLKSNELQSPTRILFEGKLYWTDLLPWYYETKMLIITIPAAIFLGVVLSICLGFLKKANRTDIIVLLAITAIAITIHSLGGDNNGVWQHLLYAEVPLFIMAAIGFDILTEMARTNITKSACALLPLIIMLVPAYHIISNHPYEHIYFNEFIGGTHNAMGRYELETYGTSNKEASDWIKDHGKYRLSGNQLFVGTRSELQGKHCFEEYKSEVSIVKIGWAERSNHIWDYAMFPVTGIEPELLTSEYFPPKNTVDTICVDNIPICLVLQRTDTCDLYGRGYLASNDVQHAIELLEDAVNHDLTNESAMVNLIDANMRINNKAEMKKWIDRYLDIVPKNDLGNYFNAVYYNTIGKNDEAERICLEIIDNNPRFNMAYLFLSTIYIQEKRYEDAESTILSLVDYDVYNEDAAKQLVRVYNAQKKDIRDAEISYYEYAYKSYERRHKKTLASKYKLLYENAVNER